MKRKHLPYIFLPVLVAAAVMLMFRDRWSTVGDDFSKLVFPSLVTSNAIRIESAVDSMTFNRKGEGWSLNDEELNEQAVENLLLGASRLVVTSVLPTDELENAEPLLSITFMDGKKRLSAFTLAEYGNGYLIVGTAPKKLYGVELPGFENIPLEKIFAPASDHYRKHLLVDLLPDEIREIEIDPLEGRAFRVVQDSIFGFRVTDSGNGNDITKEVSEHAIRMLFSYFNGIRYERVFKVVEEESSIALSPDAEIRLADVYGNTFHLEVYKYYRNGSAQEDIFQGVVRFNGQDELLLMDYIYLDLLMRGLENYLSVPSVL